MIVTHIFFQLLLTYYADQMRKEDIAVVDDEEEEIDVSDKLKLLIDMSSRLQTTEHYILFCEKEEERNTLDVTAGLASEMDVHRGRAAAPAIHALAHALVWHAAQQAT